MEYSDMEDIQRKIVDFGTQLYSKLSVSRPSTNDLSFPLLIEEENFFWKLP